MSPWELYLQDSLASLVLPGEQERKLRRILSEDHRGGGIPSAPDECTFTTSFFLAGTEGWWGRREGMRLAEGHRADAGSCGPEAPLAPPSSPAPGRGVWPPER